MRGGATGAEAFAASWFDGKTARSRAVVAEIGGDGVRIREPGGFVLAVWPAAEVHLAAHHRAGQPVRLRRGETGEARLTFADEAALGPLARCCPHLRRNPGRVRDHWRQVALWGGGAVAAILFLVFVGVPWLAVTIAHAIPPSVEVEWGDEVAGPMTRIISRVLGGGAEPRFCATPAGGAALDRLVARLTAGDDLRITPTVRVLDAPKANAVALPGGHVLVTSGILAKAEDSGEVAGVLAHEIGHVERRHALAATFKSAGLAALLSLVVGDVTGGTLIVAGTQALLETAYSRAAEREADAVAVEMLNAADISATPMARFFERLADAGDDATGLAAMLATHPASVERAATIRAVATGTGAAMSAADWQALRGICGG